MKSRGVRIALSLALSAFFLWLAARGVKWADTLSALERANYLLVLPIMAVTVWTLYIRAQRWRVFLEPVGVPPMMPIVSATMIGFMANMVLPLRIGEVVRPVLLSRKQKLPIGGILATCLLERIFDMFTILLLFGVSMLVVPVSDRAKDWGELVTWLALVIGIAIAIMRWKEEWAIGVVRRVSAPLPVKLGEAIRSFFMGFLKALEILSSPSAFLRGLGWSLFLWLVIGLLNGLGLAMFSLPLRSTFALTAIVAIAVAAPGGPGFFGSFQLGCKVALGIFAVSESDALAFSLVHHLAQFLAIVLAGLYFLWREGMSFHDLG